MADKKKVFIMGDLVEDLILVPQNKYVDVNRKSNYDLFTRDLITSYRVKSGKRILTEMLEAFGHLEVYESSGNSDVDGEKIDLETISEWKEVSSRLYLTNHIGVINEGNDEETITLSDEETKALKESDVISIYNMSGVSYCEEEQLQSIKGNAVILLRTQFDKNKQPSNFLELFYCAPDLLPKTILLFNVNELRRAGFIINKGVSWEQLMIETIDSVRQIPGCDNFKYIIVCFNHEGCLVYSKGSQWMIFYENEIEGDFVKNQNKRTFGPVLCMQAHLSSILAELDEEKTEHEDALTEALAAGVMSGLASMRKLISIGFCSPASFPAADLAEYMKKISENDKPVCIKVPDILPKDYTIISKSEEEVLNICRDIVLQGNTRSKTPFLRYNNLLSYDRFEIEQLRNIYNLISSYVMNDKMNKPLSICVFGPPGSGKSFAVKQIAKTVQGGGDTSILEFNLSQMMSPNELVSAFHQVRDAGLKGKLPIVFFDEFDSKLNNSHLGWLKYFLAPMQDGEFRDSASPHFIGRGIFVFAGGTHVSLEMFKRRGKDKDGIESKVNDFLSRIRGYINVYGPNKKMCQREGTINGKSNEQCFKDANDYRLKKTRSTPSSSHDKCEYTAMYCWETAYYLRRATLLRSILEVKLGKGSKDIIEIDKNVLEAFLKIDEYYHGSRSLETIVQMSDISPGDKYSAACINANGLDLYVDEEAFKALLDQV